MPKRVLTVSPLPPEKCAYALARYSRSPESIAQSIEWVRTHDSQKFLESFYFQYGHASIADLGHLVLCFEGISELAAIEIEDEQLWDGQARSSRYQDFSKQGFNTPPEFDATEKSIYEAAANALLETYKQAQSVLCEYLAEKHPRPESMKPENYRRSIAARAFDVSRYLLFLGIPTGVGQVTSIRTLERQIRRLKASEYAELRDLAQEAADACAATPDCTWDPAAANEPVAPTLAKHLEADTHLRQSRADLAEWASQNLGKCHAADVEVVDLCRTPDTLTDIGATLLYPVTNRSYNGLVQELCSWSRVRRFEIIDVAVRSKGARDHLLREFRSAPYAFDIVMDIGAYRDFHRHRRCQQFRQSFSNGLGVEVPSQITAAGLESVYSEALEQARTARTNLRGPGADYLIPFAAKARFLFKMDFAEAEYIARLRSGVRGHFSYRQIAWQMKEKMEQLEPELGRLLQATPPWIEDILER